MSNIKRSEIQANTDQCTHAPEPSHIVNGDYLDTLNARHGRKKNAVQPFVLPLDDNDICLNRGCYETLKGL